MARGARIKSKSPLASKKLWIMILFTILFLLIWRLGYFIHLPRLDSDFLFRSRESDSLFGFLDVYSGGALSNYSVLALGISPYITASIVVQLLQMDIVPKLKEWSEEGPAGKEKLNQLTKYLALFLAFVQGLTVIVSLSIGPGGDAVYHPASHNNAFTYVFLALVMTGGTSFCLWLSEKITKRGLGNGSSMLIVAGILASFPKMVKDLIGAYLVPKTASDGSGGVITTPVSGGDIATFIGVILILILIIVGVVFMEGAQRKIPIQYAGRSSAVLSGRRDSSLPIKLNSASVIPVIFASTLLSIPTTIANFIGAGKNDKLVELAKAWLIRIFSSTKPIGFALYIILIYLFSFFYSFLQINPDQIAENLQKQNAYIPGVRPGDETASYISRVLFKITMVGATYLTIVAIIPIILSWIFALPASVQIGGTGLIIVVGVALETTKQIKSETEEKEYKGLLS